MTRMHHVLQKIIENKIEEVEEAKKRMPLVVLKDELDRNRKSTPAKSFATALRNKSRKVNIIAEIKRASPTAVFVQDDSFDPVAVARSYESAGACAISVLTDVRYFNGALEFARAVADNVDLPVLRKDFIIDPWQIYESAALGVSAILLMAVNFESTDQFCEMYDLALELGLEVLTEIHDEDQWRMIESVKPAIVGINNRNFRSDDLGIDIGTTTRLAPILPAGVVKVSESGISTAEDIRSLLPLVDGFLIGGAFMKQADPGRTLSELIEKV